MPLENLQALEAALASPDTDDAPETASAETGASSSQEVTTSTDTNTAPTIEDASIDDLLKALDSVPSAVAQTKPDSDETDEPGGKPAPVVVAPKETAPTDEDDEDEDDEPAPVAGEPAKPIAKNFRIHTEDPKLALYLKTLKSAQLANPKVNPADVAVIVGYSAPGAPAAAATPVARETSSEARPVDPQVKALQDQIAKIDQDIEHAENTEYDAKAVRDLERKRAEVQRNLWKKEEEVEAQALADAEFDAGYQAARAQATALCPEADDENSTQFDLVMAEVSRIKRTSPELLDEPGYPLKVLQRVAAKHPALFPKVVEKAPAVKPPAALATKPATVPAKKGVPTSRAVGVVLPGGGNQAPAIDATNAKEAVKTLSTEQLLAAVDQAAALERKRAKT